MKPEGITKGYSELPPGLLPKFVRNTLAPKVQTRGAREYEGEILTRRKAYHYICSAVELCSQDLLVYGPNSNATDDIARSKGWSALTELGWTCPSCSWLYSRGPTKAKVKANKGRRAARLEALLAHEPRGNDLAELRQEEAPPTVAGADGASWDE